MKAWRSGAPYKPTLSLREWNRFRDLEKRYGAWEKAQKRAWKKAGAKADRFVTVGREIHGEFINTLIGGNKKAAGKGRGLAGGKKVARKKGKKRRNRKRRQKRKGGNDDDDDDAYYEDDEKPNQKATGKEEVARKLNSAREQEFKLTAEIKQFKEEVARLSSQPDSDYNRKRIRMILERIKSDRKNLAEVASLIERLTQAQTHQVATGLPPDADFLYRLQNVRWWTSANLSHDDESKSARGGTSTSGSVMVGGDLRLDDNAGAGFGIGYTTSTARVGGRRTTSDGLNLVLRGYWGRSSALLFDVSAAYGFNHNTGNNAGVTDNYNVHNLGFGFGVNKARNFNRLWRVEGRLGYSASWTIREASTDSAGVRQARATNSFGRATLSGRLLRKFESGAGHLFADARISAVTHDDSTANQDKKPFEGEVGAGFYTRLGEVAALTARGFYGGIGRKARESYGGSLNLGFDF